MSQDVARADAFLARFTPPQAVKEWGYDAGGLLYDFKHKYDFTPTTAQLEQCVEAYVKLLDEVTAEVSVGILVVISASELVLAYLMRAGEAQALMVSKRVRDRLAIHAQRISRDMKTFADGAYDGDAVKRLVSINEYLKGEVPASRDRDSEPWTCGYGDPEIARRVEEVVERHRVLKETILDYLRDHDRETEVGNIWGDLQDRFPGTDIIGACLELAEEQRIKPDKALPSPSDMLRTTKIKLVE